MVKNINILFSYMKENLYILELSSVLALAIAKKLTFNGETIVIPPFDEFKSGLITIDRTADKESRWASEGLVTYGIVHEMKDGKKIVVDFMDACNLYPGKLNIMGTCDCE